jgi:hypothetical protein
MFDLYTQTSIQTTGYSHGPERPVERPPPHSQLGATVDYPRAPRCGDKLRIEGVRPPAAWTD